MLSTKVELGDLRVEIEAAGVAELIEEVQYIHELDRAREGDESARVFFREFDGYRFYGFRREDGAEITLGQHKNPASEARRLFAYSPGSEGYRGWRVYDRESGESRPVGNGAAAGGKQAAPARGGGDAVGTASTQQRELIAEAMSNPVFTAEETRRIRQRLEDPMWSAAGAVKMISWLGLEAALRKPPEQR